MALRWEYAVLSGDKVVFSNPARTMRPSPGMAAMHELGAAGFELVSVAVWPGGGSVAPQRQRVAESPRARDEPPPVTHYTTTTQVGGVAMYFKRPMAEGE